MPTEIVFAAYRPHPGKSEALTPLVREHLPTLRKLGLATDREGMLVRAKDGTWIEVFEWSSAEAARNAHEHPAVARIWEAMGKVCDFVSLASLEEAAKPFAHFAPADR